MDDFSRYFSFGDETPIFARPEIQDAIERIVKINGSDKTYSLDISDPIPHQNPALQSLHIVLLYSKGDIAQPQEYVVWVDDFELMFTVMDEPW